jgi:hypothetical protein
MHVSSMRPPGTTRLAIGIGALLATGLIAACGNGAAANGASSTTSSNKSADALKFSQCMRDHGINIPDPQTNGNGGFSLKIQGGSGTDQFRPDDPKFKAAQDACNKYLPNGGQLTPEQQAQAQQNALKFARCMRDHGINIPDPQTSGGGIKIEGPNGVNFNDPKFQQAQQACQKYLSIPGGPGLSTQGQGTGQGTGPSNAISGG